MYFPLPPVFPPEFEELVRGDSMRAPRWGLGREWYVYGAFGANGFGGKAGEA